MRPGPSRPLRAAYFASTHSVEIRIVRLDDENVCVDFTGTPRSREYTVSQVHFASEPALHPETSPAIVARRSPSTVETSPSLKSAVRFPFL